jgi:multicomponent Na+:H+ antiporter subunit E
MTRFVAALLAWLVLLPSIAIADVAIGVAAAACASWVSIRLAPPGTGRIGIVALLAYVPHFLWFSLRGGLDVARRAMLADMRLLPGVVDVPTALPRGFARHTFATITSLMPGSLPCGDTPSSLHYHCLDVAQPVAHQLQEEEHALRDALVPLTQ